MPRRMPPYKVIITSHAKDRWKERGGYGKLTAGLVRQRLMGALGCGAEVLNEVGAIEVEVGCGLKAICIPDPAGMWVAVTVAGSRGTGEEAG